MLDAHAAADIAAGAAAHASARAAKSRCCEALPPAAWQNLPLPCDASAAQGRATNMRLAATRRTSKEVEMMGLMKNAALAASLVATLATPVRAAEKLPTIDLAVGTHKVTAEVAATEPARTLGLMHRKKPLAENAGMLFVFAQASFHGMWMQNTYIPLSVAFIDEQGVILNIADMAPLTTQAHTAAGFARYALEMNQGWFAARGIRAGAKVSGLEKAPPPR